MRYKRCGRGVRGGGESKIFVGEHFEEERGETGLG